MELPEVESDADVQDTSKQEKDFKKKNTLWGQLTDEGLKGASFFTVYLGLVVLLGLVLIAIGIWASVQCTMFFPITTQASISVIIMSILLIIVGLLIITTILGCVLGVRYEKASRSDLQHCLILTVPAALLIFLAVTLIILGITIQLLIAERLVTISSDTFMYNSQETIEAWDSAQRTLRCCGAMNFSDYEQVFNNFSVPVSCCNTTSPLINETTCSDIVMDIEEIDITELIYTESCIHQLEGYFRQILHTISGISIVIGILLINGELLSLIYCVVEFYPKNSVTEDKIFIKTLYRCFHIVMGLILFFSVAFIAVPIWALVRNSSFYYSITAPVSTDVLTLSIVLIVVGGIMFSVSVCQMVSGAAMWSNVKKPKFKIFGEFSFVCLFILPMLLIAVVVGILAAFMSGPTSIEFNNILRNYLSDQSAQEAWNALQENMKCCGVVDFTDYETVFNNFSVPVSCCNATSSLAINCPDIVRNAQQSIDQLDTDIIYSEGCEPHLKLFFTNLFMDISAPSIIVSGLQIIATINWLCLFSYATIRNWKKLFNNE